LKFFRSLQTKTALAFLAVSAVSLLALLMVADRHYSRQIREHAEADLRTADSILHHLYRPSEGPLPGDVAHRFSAVTRTDVSFVKDGELAGTTMPPLLRDLFARQIKAVPGPVPERNLDGHVLLEHACSSADGWTHYLHRPLEESLLEARSLRWWMIITGLVILMAAGLSGFRLAVSVTRPVRDLVRGTRDVKEGRLDRRLSVDRADEVGELSRSFNDMIARLQERERIRSTMDKVVSHEIAEEILKGDIKPGGEIRFSTVLFSDIRGFTEISESHEPQELVKFLNDYLTLMSQIVEKNKGVIDKYIGDSVMALFGAPVNHEGDVDNGLDTAMEMLWKLKEFNYRRAWEGKPAVTIGIGLNTGPVVAGNMGSEKRLNYTVLGDAVNLASRLERLTRIYSVHCLVSEFTQRESRRGFVFRELDLVRVKGRSTAVRIYELCEQGENKDRQTEMLQRFQNARQFYLLKDWERSARLFKQVLELCPGDGPSQLYLSRIEQLAKSPPPETWDGVYYYASR